MTRSMGSGERKRCSNMAPVRKLRSLAWMNARRFPGVRCSTLKTVCSSLLCLMIMPGRICVAGIAIKEKLLHLLGGTGVDPDCCLAALDPAACAVPAGRDRMELASATNTNRESGDRLKVDCSACLGGT